jgi:molecular chaperone GrpE
MEKRPNDTDNQQQEDPSSGAATGNDTQPTAEPVQGIELTPEREVKTGSETEAGADSEIRNLQAQIAEKDKEIIELKDRYLRALADSENARKRIRQQSDESIRLQRENLLRELLPIVDNLERAVDAARGGGNGKPIVEGVEMVLRGLLDFLKTHGVTQISSVGQPFDPERHEAVDHIETAQHAPSTVVNEFHRGYQIGDRLLRPARVAVAKPPPKPGDDGQPNGPGGNES